MQHAQQASAISRLWQRLQGLASRPDGAPGIVSSAIAKARDPDAGTYANLLRERGALKVSRLRSPRESEFTEKQKTLLWLAFWAVVGIVGVVLVSQIVIHVVRAGCAV